MPGYLPLGALYGRQRDEPIEVPACNPVPPAAMHLESGNAGADGYSVISRANRYTGERKPMGTPEPEWPNMSED